VKRLGSISVNDLQIGLNEIGIFPTVDECSLFIARYDQNRKGRLNFEEF
jgi:Ca2+-binding EF-hand superfamily protein